MAPQASHIGLAIPVVDLSCFEPIASIRAVALGLRFSTLGTTSSELSMFPRRPSCLDSACSVPGRARFSGILSALGFGHLGFLSLPRGFVQKELSLLVLSFASFGLMLPLQSSMDLGSIPLISGLGCLELSFFMPDASRFALSLSVRSSACSDAYMLAFDFAELDSCSSLQRRSCPGSLFSTCAKCSESLSLVLDMACTGAFLSAQGSARCATSLSVVDFANVGRQTSFKALAKVGLDLFVGSSSLAPTIFALDSASLGPPSATQSSSQIESQTLAKGVATFESSLSLRSFARLEFSLLVPAVSVKAFVMFVLESATLDFPLPLKSFQCCGRISVHDIARFGFPLLSRSPSQTSLVLFVLGFLWPEILLLIADVCLDFSLPSQSFTQTGPFPSVLHLGHLGIPLSVRFCRLELFMLIGGLRCLGCGLGKSLLVSDLGHLEVLLPLKCCGLCASVPVLSFVQSDLVMAPKNVLHLDATSTLCRSTRVEEVLSAPASGTFGSSLLLQAPPRLNVPASLFGMSYQYSLLFPQMSSHLGPFLLLMKPHHSEPILLVPDCCSLGAFVLMKSFSKLGSFLDLSGVVAIEYLALLSLRDCASFGLSIFVRSFVKPGIPLSVSDFTRSGLPLALRSSRSLGSTTSSCGYS